MNKEKETQLAKLLEETKIPLVKVKASLGSIMIQDSIRKISAF